MASGLQFVVLLCLCGLWIGADAECKSDCAICPRGWTGFGQKCYMFHRRERSWISAERLCNYLGGNLASLQCTNEYNFIRDLILRVTGFHKSTWVGGHDAVIEGVWLWSDGSTFAFTGWAHREPSNYKRREHCMEINFAGRDYVNDNRCYRRKSFVCAMRK